MDVVILYSQNDKNNISKFSEFFVQSNIGSIFYEIVNDWENDEIFLDIVKKNEYFLIITSKETFNEKWFKFIVGYCLGKSCSLFLYLLEKNFNMPENLSFINFGFDFDKLNNFYIEENKIWHKKTEIKNIKNIISSKLSFTSMNFFYLIEKNDIETVELFLKADFSPDLKNEKGIYAFNYAVRFGHNDIAKKLMEYNCDIFKISSDNGNNALMDAAAEGNIEMIKILIDKEIDLDIQSKNDQTALMLAVGRNNEEIVELLLKNEADAGLKDVLDMTALRYAEILKYKNIINLIKKYQK